MSVFEWFSLFQFICRTKANFRIWLNTKNHFSVAVFLVSHYSGCLSPVTVWVSPEQLMHISVKLFQRCCQISLFFSGVVRHVISHACGHN